MASTHAFDRIIKNVRVVRPYRTAVDLLDLGENAFRLRALFIDPGGCRGGRSDESRQN